MFENQNKFIEELGGELSPEQAAILLDMADGDTANAETDDTPAVEPEEAKPAETENAPDGGDTEENPVILAKDGKHTIPYEKLVEAREAERAAREEAALAKQQLEALKNQALQREAGAPDDKDDDIGGFDSLFDDDADIKKTVEEIVAKREAEIEKRVMERMKPLEEQRAKDAAQAHYRVIYDAHPDADSIAESKELADWVNGQPSYTRGAIQSVLENGTASQVVEVLDAFKAATQKDRPAVNHEDVKSGAKKIVENAKPTTPNTLSDIPAGRAAPKSDFDALSEMTPAQMADAMATWPPEKIERYLNSV